MAGFLYYLPGQRPPSRERLSSVGFPHAHEAAAHTESPGPDGGRGYVFALKPTSVPGSRQPEPIFDPQSVNAEATEPKQVWHKCADGAWWLGWNLDDQPRPVDLARTKSLVGVDMLLTDGATWRIPQMRAYDGLPRVSCVLDITPDGKIVANEPAPQYRRLWDAMVTALEKAGRAENIFDNEQTINLVCDVVAWNYRVTIWELMKLGVLELANFGKMFQVVAGLRDEDAQ